jgi:hypothetical protein
MDRVLKVSSFKSMIFLLEGVTETVLISVFI